MYLVQAHRDKTWDDEDRAQQEEPVSLTDDVPLHTGHPTRAKAKQRRVLRPRLTDEQVKYGSRDRDSGKHAHSHTERAVSKRSSGPPGCHTTSR